MDTAMGIAWGNLFAFWETSSKHAHPEGWMGAAIALIALAAMEIVLGIDNIIFISIITGKLPAEQQPSARRWGLILALGMRIGLLCSLYWIMNLVHPIFSLSSFAPTTAWYEWLMEAENTQVNEVSWKDVILIVGGLFLLVKSVKEIHALIEGHEDGSDGTAKKPSFMSVLIQIAMLDIVFSLDSVITAVGMAEDLWVMVTAVIIAVGVMLIFANQVSLFVQRNPTVKMLALSFLLMIGVMLLADGLGTHVSKGYVYFAMTFSLLVEVLNMRARKRKVDPAFLH